MSLPAREEGPRAEEALPRSAGSRESVGEDAPASQVSPGGTGDGQQPCSRVASTVAPRQHRPTLSPCSRCRWPTDSPMRAQRQRASVEPRRRPGVAAATSAATRGGRPARPRAERDALLQGQLEAVAQPQLLAEREQGASRRCCAPCSRAVSRTTPCDGGDRAPGRADAPHGGLVRRPPVRDRACRSPPPRFPPTRSAGRGLPRVAFWARAVMRPWGPP